MPDLTTALVVATLGREAFLRDLLDSLEAGDVVPAAVVVADQSHRRLDVGGGRPFPVLTVTSSGGASRARNDGLAALSGGADYVAFPNDHSRFAPDTLAAVQAAALQHGRPEVIAGVLAEPDGARFELPPEGTLLDRSTVWRVIEPTMFVARGALPQPAFDERLGTGGPTPWQSGEGTDLLLRVMAAGGRVVSCPSIRVLGPGERRDLSQAEYRSKLRAYGRGTGYVYRLHDYPRWQQARLVLAPWVRWAQSGDPSRDRGRAAFLTALGRWEGVRGRTVSRLHYRPR